MFAIVAWLNRRARRIPRESPLTSVTPALFHRYVCGCAHGDPHVGAGQVLDRIRNAHDTPE